MAVDVRVETVVDRPADEVARYVMDPANDTSWIGGITEARVVGDAAVGEGTRVARVASFLGRRIEYVNEIETFDPPSQLVMRSVKAPFPMRITYTFDDREGRTVTSVRVEGDATGFYRLAGPMLARAVRRSVTGDLANLKRILESS